MAEECAESCSVTTYSSSAVVPQNKWWDLHGAAGPAALSSWCNNSNTSPNSDLNPWHHHQAAAPPPNPSSNSDEDVSISTSFTNASNHSGLTVESSRRLLEPAASSSDDLIAPEQQAPSDSQIWSHVFLNVGSNGDLQNHQDVGENFLDMLSSSKSMYDPACDYLKKLDSSWDHELISNSSSTFNGFTDHKPLNNGFNDTMNHVENERLTNKLSSLISAWSIAPPEPELSADINRHFNPQTCNISLSSSMNQHHLPQSHNFGHIKPTFGDSAGLFPPYYFSTLKVESGHGGGEMEAPAAAAASGALLRKTLNASNRYQVGLNGSSNMAVDNGKYHYGMTPVDSYSNSKNFADVISFSGRLGKPLIGNIDGPNNNKPCVKSLSLSDSKKQGLQTSSPQTRSSSGRGQGNTSTEGKKKRSEDTNSETSLKKPKQESSTASSAKVQAPKVKLGDRITALQQIVSPFGKTDTASVLYEAIQYIKFLQEQVQLLSNPYMKTNPHKDPWGSLDRKDHLKGDNLKLDLRSRGLCLVPISCTPQIYRENTGSDYWTPTYRGSLYR